MKFVKYIVPYLLISPVSVAVFFIALCISCISIESVLHAVLPVFGMASLISKTAQVIFVASAGAAISIIAAAIFMNKAVWELRHTHSFFRG